MTNEEMRERMGISIMLIQGGKEMGSERRGVKAVFIC
jgi:hypothetical protein